MATSSSDDITTQLAALLGCAIKRLRITNEKPPRISVIDLAAVITTKDANQVAEQVSYVKKRHPEVTEIFGDFKFSGQGQKNTAVTDLRGAVELTFLLPGHHATRVRRQAAELLCRWLGVTCPSLMRYVQSGVYKSSWLPVRQKTHVACSERQSKPPLLHQARNWHARCLT